MSRVDHDEFQQQLRVLLAGFPDFQQTPENLEAYTRGLERMSLPMFRRCIDEILGPSGKDKVPTVSRIWQISRSLRAAQQPPSQMQIDGTTTATTQSIDIFASYCNRVFLAWCLKHSPDSQFMPALIAEKNRIANTYRSICSEEPEAEKDVKGKLIEAIEAAYRQQLSTTQQQSPHAAA